MAKERVVVAAIDLVERGGLRLSNEDVLEAAVALRDAVFELEEIRGKHVVQ